jgi:hypothetical protein
LVASLSQLPARLSRAAPTIVSPRRHRTLSQVLFAAIVYLATAFLVTWPLVLHLGSSIYLPPTGLPAGGGDIAGSIAHLREFAEGAFPFAPGRIHDFNAPDGLPVRWPLNLANAPSLSLLSVLAVAVGAQAAYGLFVILGYVASGIAMFLFVRGLTGSAWIALVIGWAFAFYPFPVVQGEHPHFLHGWVFVLMGWRLLVLAERPTLRNGLWAGAAGVLAVSWTHYFILLGGVFYAALTVAVVVVGLARGDLRTRLLPAAAGAGLVFGFIFAMRQLMAVSSAPDVGAAHDFRDIIATSAEPLMYLVPPSHTLLGRWTQPFLAERGIDGVEWTLYLGVTTMALALVGLVAASMRAVAPRLRLASLLALAAVVSGLVFSAPPQIELFGHLFRTPSYLVYSATPTFRLYSRFGMVVMFGVCVLAAVALSAVTRGQSRRATAVVLALATVLVPLDLWNRPAHAVRDLRAPAIYHVLRAQPPGIVAEYPIRPIPFTGHYLDLYYQGVHDHPILNGFFRDSYQERALVVADLSDPATAGKLATLGVRYILVEPKYLWVGVPPPGTPRKGFRLIAKDDYGRLYRVVAGPQPLITGWKGFAPLEGRPGARYQWAAAPPIQLQVLAPCSPCRGALVFTTASFARPRQLEIRGPGGSVLRRVTVPVEPITVAVPLRFDRKIILDLAPSPGPQSIDETLHNGDPRKVTVWVGQTRFVQIPVSP